MSFREIRRNEKIAEETPEEEWKKWKLMQLNQELADTLVGTEHSARILREIEELEATDPADIVLPDFDPDELLWP